MKINRKLPSFNLQEILVVLAIIGILLLLALPNLRLKPAPKAIAVPAPRMVKGSGTT